MSQPEMCISEEEVPEDKSVEPSEEIQGSDPHKKESKHKLLYDEFYKTFTSLHDPLSKLETAITFMESTLSGPNPFFKNFWDAKNLSLELFKANLPLQSRAALWNKYTELSGEAKRQKELHEEQSAFDAEQIEIAIAAIEKEFQENKPQTSSHPIFHDFSQTLEKKLPFYEGIQAELNHLNIQASRINALRKELIRLEMRIRIKNKFFGRLSTAGDQVFPKRKNLIRELSERFTADIEAFIHANFDKTDLSETFFFLREEIKALQGVAKVLTLNTHAFTHTRLRLSECWDKIKVFEKDRKKARAQQKTVFKDNQVLVEQKIAELSKEIAQGTISLNDSSKKIQEITTFMRQVELGRDEVKSLRDEISKIERSLYDKQKQEAEEKLNADRTREQQKRQYFTDLKQECTNLLATTDELSSEDLSAKKEALQDKISGSAITKLEKQELERHLKPLRDIIAEKKEKSLLALTDDDRQKLESLKILLKDKKARRQEIKEQMEVYRRKVKGGSGLDIEQAITLNEQLEEERARLEKISQGIGEIEDLIEEVENR